MCLNYLHDNCPWLILLFWTGYGLADDSIGCQGGADVENLSNSGYLLLVNEGLLVLVGLSLVEVDVGRQVGIEYLCADYLVFVSNLEHLDILLLHCSIISNLLKNY